MFHASPKEKAFVDSVKVLDPSAAKSLSDY